MDISYNQNDRMAHPKEKKARSQVYKRGAEANWNPIVKMKAKQLAAATHAMKQREHKRTSQFTAIREDEEDSDDSYYTNIRNSVSMRNKRQHNNGHSPHDNAR